MIHLTCINKLGQSNSISTQPLSAAFVWFLRGATLEDIPILHLELR